MAPFRAGNLQVVRERAAPVAPVPIEVAVEPLRVAAVVERAEVSQLHRDVDAGVEDVLDQPERLVRGE